MNKERLMQMAKDGVEQSNFTEGGHKFEIRFRMELPDYARLSIIADGKTLRGGALVYGSLDYVINGEGSFEKLADIINGAIDGYLDQENVAFTPEENSALLKKLSVPTGGIKLTSREAKALSEFVQKNPLTSL
ncbi:MAG: hypothetical protein FWC00_01525 [Firmicutes bacterium]|nr:hypothetical protein [Bacillota bacterium]